MSTRPDSMGIYGDLQKKREAAYDKELEGRVKEWMEKLIGHSINGATFQEGLMDGVALCECMNACYPGKIKKIRNSPVMLFRRENFGAFFQACLSIGLAENDLCQFEDVYDNKNMGQFLIMMIAFARKVQYEPNYKGPILEDAVKQATANKRNFTEAQLRAGEAVVPLAQAGMNEAASKAQSESRYVEHGIIMDPELNPSNRK